MKALSKRQRLIAIVAVALLLALAVALQLATRQLKGQIEQALGPRAHIGSVQAGWTGLTVVDLRIAGAAGWPADDELRAQRVHVTPDPRSLFGRPWRVASVRIDDGFIAITRSRDGRPHVLPALLEAPSSAPPDAPSPTAAASPSSGTQLIINHIELSNATVAFFDASVRQPPHAMRLEQLSLDAGPWVLPALDRPVELTLSALFKGPQHDGHVTIKGPLTPSTHDADLRAEFKDVDLLTLQPYLLKSSEASIQHGALDLSVQATVAKNRLHAPGHLVLRNLQLSSGNGVVNGLAGVSRQAVLAAMSDKGRIDIHFMLDGRFDDPAFSLNEHLAKRVGSAFAEALGVSVSGVVHGVKNVVQGLFGR